ncbi:MAG: cysteine synthase CysM [Trueperaceae bacterium]|nr:cysteine synthase CysM [Trueperaceae bacterium]
MTLSLERLIGNTPLVRLRQIPESQRVAVFAKLEGQNPGGSVKDRPAYSMIRGALDRGEVRPGDRLIEATSGNTGIALAMIARLLGLRMTLLMPDDSTEERVRALRAYGAELILTPAERSIEHSRELAEKMVEAGEGKMLDQFANPDNVAAHVRTTGPEIWRDTDGKVTHFVSAMGTTGTIMGVSTYLKSVDPGITVVGTQPSQGSKIPGIRRWSPEYLPAIYKPELVDRMEEVSEEEATLMTRRLAREEGILAGMSSGGALVAALRLARELDDGVIVFIVCDRGDRYLSSNLFG